MKKSKKGFTLIEIICGLVILGIAVIVGAQTFAAAGTGYTNAAQFDHGVDYIFNAFENGTEQVDLPPNVTKSTAKNVEVAVTVNAVKFSKSVSLTEVTFNYEVDKVSARLFGLSNAYGINK